MFVLKLSDIQKYIQTFSTYMYKNFSIPEALIPSFKPSSCNNIKPFKISYTKTQIKISYYY